MLSERVRRITPSATVEMTAKVAELRKAGVDIIALNVGEPDFNTPDNINEAAKRAIDAGKTKYTPVTGILELREAICAKFKRDLGLDYTPAQIVVSTGAKQSLVNTIMTLCNPGDEVIVPAPCWVSYNEMIKLADAIPVIIELKEEEEFALDINAIEAAITPKTRIVLINTPNNPTGAVYKEDALRKLGELAVKHDFYIISDEVYEKLVYDGEKHVSVATLAPEFKERTIIVNALSKAYAMTGWRLGFTASTIEIAKGMNALQGHMTFGTNSITQYAAVEALNGSQETVAAMKAKFDERRKYLLRRLRSMKDITCADAKGAFYFMPNVSKLYGKKYKGKELKDSMDVTMFLLEEAHIAPVDGGSFESPNNIRISYSNSLENLEKAMDRMEKALNILE